MEAAIVGLIKQAEDLGDDDLFTQIGKENEALLEEASEGGDILHFDVKQSAKELGLRLFKRLSREMHQLFCGNEKEDAEHRNNIAKALKLDRTLLSASIAGVLINAFGVAVPVAALVAVLLVRYVFLPAGDEVCRYWGEQL